MKFIFADSIDQVDPGYNFENDRNAPGRRPYWSDRYAHEIFAKAPYDGILVSRGIVGDYHRKGKYNNAHAIRLRREGARKVLRLDTPKFKHMPIYGDCGAFSYANEKEPPYSAEDMAQFYLDGRFTHGCSVDHIIFDFRPEDKELDGALGDDKFRFDITQSNAEAFLKASRSIPNFIPLGAVQGWSPDSMGIAAKRLEKMGYKYLAIGGMVPLSAPQIHLALQAIRKRIKPSTELHILGFAKAEQIHEFTDYGISSFDSTSPLYRAFMDAKANYYVRRRNGELDYFTAIRIPLAFEDRSLSAAAMEGRIRQEDAAKKEKKALAALRDFDRGALGVEDTLKRVMEYQKMYQWVKCKSLKAFEKTMIDTEASVRRTLEAAPWKKCKCEVCKSVGIEVIIFRSSNRNKRRGFHNLHIYSNHVSEILNGH